MGKKVCIVDLWNICLGTHFDDTMPNIPFHMEHSFSMYLDSVHIHLHRRACQACMCIFSSDQVAFSLCVFVSNFLLTNRRVTQERHSATLSTALLFYTSLPTSVSPHKGLLSSISDGNGSILRRPHSASLFWSNHKIPPKPNNRKQWGTC